MPELPDVAVFKKYFDSTSLHQEIDKVVCHKSKLFESSIESIQRTLNGKSFSSSYRHGKYLFGELDKGGFLLMHFGMTGNLQYYKKGEEPEYAQMIIHFKKEYSLAYKSVRKLGKIELVDDMKKYIKSQGLGPDMLDLSKTEFGDIMKSKRGMIKTALMDQSTICGLGNIYTDEVLFQEKIHPETDLADLNDKQLENLYNTINRVIEVAINHKANPKDFPNNYLTPHRKEGEDCPQCSGKLKNIKVGGRTTWFCPICQKL